MAPTRFFTSLPSKKKHRQYYVHIPGPIDLQTIDRNINTGFYASADHFDRDLLRLCQNNIRFYGHLSAEGKSATKMRKAYNVIKQEYFAGLEEILGPAGAAVFKKREESKPEEDVIRCPCGQYKDEGVMIQCEKCQVWQHCDCVGKTGEEEETFFCENCSDKNLDLNIVLTPQPEFAVPGEKYYTSLVRDDLQICLGDTVYVLRAFKETDKEENDVVDEDLAKEEVEAEKAEEKEGEKEKEVPDKEKEFSHGGIPHKMMSPLKGPSQEASTLSKGNYPTYRTVGDDVNPADMDIFRIERLWTNEKGDRFAFGHHYLRPHETFHEPNRKFFHNEVFRVPIYEVLPLDTIWKKCWVMDIPTYCKGRPIGSVEEHVYICEYRVDKTARLFNKISKPKYPVCTKEFAFDFFDQKLKPQRNYAVSFIL